MPNGTEQEWARELEEERRPSALEVAKELAKEKAKEVAKEAAKEAAKKIVEAGLKKIFLAVGKAIIAGLAALVGNPIFWIIVLAILVILIPILIILGGATGETCGELRWTKINDPAMYKLMENTAVEYNISWEKCTKGAADVIKRTPTGQPFIPIEATQTPGSYERIMRETGGYAPTGQPIFAE
jgi:hypothetical protein